MSFVYSVEPLRNRGLSWVLERAVGRLDTQELGCIHLVQKKLRLSLLSAPDFVLGETAGEDGHLTLRSAA